MYVFYNFKPSFYVYFSLTLYSNNANYFIYA